MKEFLYMMRFICAAEGFSGFIINLILLFFLLRSHIHSNKCFLVPIYISALQGLYLCPAIGFMNFNHIFYDGTLAVPLVGPSVQFIPKFWRDLLYQTAFVFMSFMWTLTPSTCILQFTALSRNDLTKWKRLVISFIPTAICLIFVGYTIPMTMPSPELAEIMGREMKELYGMKQDEFLECYGVSIKHADINNGKSVILFVVTFTAIPYSISYTIIVTLMIMIRRMLSSDGVVLSKHTLRLQRHFFVMQFLQSFLPLIILSVPLAIIMYGALSGAQLGFWGLPLTIFVWLCPVVQASVQLRYVWQAAFPPESIMVQISKTDATRIQPMGSIFYPLFIPPLSIHDGRLDQLVMNWLLFLFSIQAVIAVQQMRGARAFIYQETPEVKEWPCSTDHHRQERIHTFYYVNSICPHLMKKFGECCAKFESCQKVANLGLCVKRERFCLYNEIPHVTNAQLAINNYMVPDMECAEAILTLHARRPDIVFSIRGYDFDRYSVYFFSVILAVALSLIICVPILMFCLISGHSDSKQSDSPRKSSRSRASSVRSQSSTRSSH